LFCGLNFGLMILLVHRVHQPIRKKQDKNNKIVFVWLVAGVLGFVFSSVPPSFQCHFPLSPAPRNKLDYSKCTRLC
jgi:hypothetical protein